MANRVRKVGAHRKTPAGTARLLSQVLESTSDCILSLDREWRVTYLNRRAQTELQFATELIGVHILDAYPQLAKTPFWVSYQRVMSTRQPHQLEAFMPGLNRWYDVYVAPTDDGITIFFRNIDARKRGEEALREGEVQFKKTLNKIPQMVWATLPDGYHDYFNQPWYEFTGVADGSTDGEEWNNMFHPEDQERAWKIWRRSLETGEPYEIEYRLRHRSGEYRWVLGRAWPERDQNNEIVRWYGTCTDISDRVCAQQALQQSQLFQQSMLEASADCIKVLGLDGKLEFMNSPGCRAMDLESFDQVRGRIWPSLWPVESQRPAQDAIDRARLGEVSRFAGYLPTAKGQPKWWDVVTSPIMNEAGEVVRLLSISRDVTAIRETADQLRWASDHDALTSLPNRRAFNAHLQAAILRAMNRGVPVALLLLDLDYFKHVNDTLGHSAGDHLLQVFAERLTSVTREGDFVARLGGDEFAVILENFADEKEISEVGAAIVSRLKAPVNYDGRMISGSASIGGAIYPRDAQTANELMKNTDTALYALKAAGRGGTRMFQRHMRVEAQNAASQLNLARTAVTDQSVVPHYQPKVHLQTGHVTGFEALLRWQHPTRGMQYPDTVLEAFEDYELASKVGKLMHEKVLEDISTWLRRGIDLDHVSLNAAPAEFLRDDYAEKLLSRLERYQVPTPLIEVEITEHAFLERKAQYVARALGKLKEAGIRISLDDFGTGHSSLSHLRDFPVDVVKIDRSFIAQMIHDNEVAAIVRAVVDLSHSLSLKVVAEGVETAGQRDFLNVIGCDFGQGWYFGKAVSADELFRIRQKAA